MKNQIVFIAFPDVKLISFGYPLGLAYISSVLKKNGYDVNVFDYSICRYNSDRFINDIKKINPEFIGFTVYTYSYRAIKTMISLLRRELPRTKIIIGGPHVSALPVFSLEDLNADFSIIGEAEFIILDLIKRIESGRQSFDDLKGIAFWKDNKPVLNPGCNLIYNLDELPYPAWELFPPEKYTDIGGQVFFKDRPIGAVITSRGCPHHCSFCASHVIHGRNFRRRSPKKVVDEIEILIKHYGIKEMVFYDDTFSELPDHALGICEEIIKRKLHISWRTEVGLRLDTLDEKLIKTFKASGCYLLGFGIESINNQVLAMAKKPLLKSCITDKIQMIKKYGIETLGYFMMGLPGDTEISIRETISFAKHSLLDFMVFHPTCPLPGSEIFNQRYAKSDLRMINWDNFNYFTRSPFEISEVPASKVKRFCSFGFLLCYSKPSRILKIIINFLYLRKTKITKIAKSLYYLIINLL